MPPTAADSHEDLWAKGRYLIRSNQIRESSEPTCGTPTKCAQIDAQPAATRAATAAVFRSNGFGPQRGTEAQCVPSRRRRPGSAHGAPGAPMFAQTGQDGQELAPVPRPVLDPKSTPASGCVRRVGLADPFSPPLRSIRRKTCIPPRPGEEAPEKEPSEP